MRSHRAAILLVIAAAAAGAGLAGCSSGHHTPSAIARSPTTTTTTVAPPTSISAANTTTRCPVSATPATGLGPPPAGLVALTIYQQGRVPFPSAVFTDPSVGGVDLLAQWSNLEPAPGTFDWPILDCVFEQADVHHKFVALTLTPGFTSPSWVLQLPGVQTQSFRYSYSNKAAARPLPLPWNQPYLTSWFTFLGAVAARYGTNPEFRLIQVAGPTSVSSEMSLPDHTSGDTALPASANGSDVAEWISLGYTPTRYVDAWRQAFAAYHRLFPDQYLALALYPGLPIGDNGSPDPAQSNATRLDVIAVGMEYKPQFDLQEDGVKGGVPPPSDPAYNSVMANCGNIVTGLQNAKSTTVSPSEQGPPSLALGHVVAAGVDFWEVYTQDVVNPTMQAVMAKASAELPAGSGCKPLVLTVGPRQGASVTLTAVTDLRLDSSEALNIYDGAKLLRKCPTSTCSVTTSSASASNAYTADVGAAGTQPYTAQAVVSATSGPR